MLKRTKGRLLISLLVVTGLAGTLNTSTLSQKERKFAVQQMKQTRNEVINAVTGLSTDQLNYKAPGSRSIREIVYSLTSLETSFAKEIKRVMQMTPDSEKRLLIQHNDEELGAVELSAATPKEKNHFADINDAIHEFTVSRNEHIRYLRTSTEDLRNRVTKSDIGWVDAYQKFILHLNVNNKLLAEIASVRSSANFPKD